METQTQARFVIMICPNLKCRKVLQVPAKYRGRQVKCHFCGKVMTVPNPKQTNESEKPAPAPGKGSKEKKG